VLGALPFLPVWRAREYASLAPLSGGALFVPTKTADEKGRWGFCPAARLTLLTLLRSGPAAMFAIMDAATLIVSLIAAFLIGRMLGAWYRR
jgi:hypothetical protein